MLAALQQAIDAASIALAPSLDLSLVPSAYISDASRPTSVSLIIVLILSTAFVTPLPKYLDLSPSLNSRASNSPVEAPDGAVPRPTVHMGV